MLLAFVRKAAAALLELVRSYTYLLVHMITPECGQYVANINRSTAAASSQQACTAAQQQQYRIHTRHITLHYVEQLVAV